MSGNDIPLKPGEKEDVIKAVISEFKIGKIVKPAKRLRKITELVAGNRDLATADKIREKLIWISVLAQHKTSFEELCEWAAASDEEHEAKFDRQLAREEQEMYGKSSELFQAIEEADAAELARLLKKKGTDLEEISPRHDGMTPLLLACSMSDAGIVAQLLEAGARVENAGEHHCLPIHYAVHGLKTLTILIDAGANVNNLAEDDITPLHVAAENDRCLPQVQLLLQHGADPNLRDKTGSTALDVALKNKAEKIADLLRRAG